MKAASRYAKEIDARHHHRGTVWVHHTASRKILHSSLHTQQSTTRDLPRCNCSKPKGYSSHSYFLCTRSNQYDITLRVPAWFLIYSTFFAHISGFTRPKLQWTQTHSRNLRFVSSLPQQLQTYLTVKAIPSDSSPIELTCFPNCRSKHPIGSCCAWKSEHIHFLTGKQDSLCPVSLTVTWLPITPISCQTNQIQHQVLPCPQCHDGSYLSAPRCLISNSKTCMYYYRRPTTHVLLLNQCRVSFLPVGYPVFAMNQDPCPNTAWFSRFPANHSFLLSTTLTPRHYYVTSLHCSTHASISRSAVVVLQVPLLSCRS